MILLVKILCPPATLIQIYREGGGNPGEEKKE
jgi:hypothetical protein